MTRARPPWAWIAVAALTALGLALRIAAARGALWLDEAWSATFAQDAVTPLGVVLRINHDNNHILNTWWLQFVGPGAPPMLQRGLSIACGTAAIPLAAAFAHQRGVAAAVVAALLFAVSPILVTYGAEARGYAPMLAAALAILVLVDRWLEGGHPPATIGIALAALLGILAQPIMLAPLLATTGWAALVLWRRDGLRSATVSAARVLGPALVAAAAVIGTMILAARAAPHGFAVGSYVPFAMVDWADALNTALGWTLGFAPVGWPLLAAAGALVAAMLVARRRDPRVSLYAVAILAYPLAFALLRIGNAGIPRYYLLASTALLLLLAEEAGRAIERPGLPRWLGGLAIALFAVGSGRMDTRIATNLRADPARIVAAMQTIAPAGTTLMLPDKRMNPVLDWATRDAHYPLTLIATGCRPAPFLLIDHDRKTRPAPLERLCCGNYRLVAQGSAEGLSGTDWWLFHRLPQ